MKGTELHSLVAIFLLCATACASGADSASQTPKYIQTVYGTTGSVPYEVAVTKLNVTADLHESTGKLISIIGARQEVSGQAAIWIPDGRESITILVRDQKPWSGAPSHRSLIYITGFLTIEKGKMFLDRTTWKWIDS